MTRLKRYLTRWVELLETDKTYDGICELILKGQFIHSCSKDLSLYLRERSPGILEELAKVAEQFVIAHERQLPAFMRPVKGKQSQNKQAVWTFC